MCNISIAKYHQCNIEQLYEQQKWENISWLVVKMFITSLWSRVLFICGHQKISQPNANWKVIFIKAYQLNYYHHAVRW